MPNITFNITNIAPNLQEMTMVVFYQFSDGEVISHKVPANTPVEEILQWGQEKCVWLDERGEEIQKVRKQLLENPIVEEFNIINE